MCWFNEFPKYNSINNDERIWGIDYNNKSSNEKKSGNLLVYKFVRLIRHLSLLSRK